MAPIYFNNQMVVSGTTTEPPDSDDLVLVPLLLLLGVMLAFFLMLLSAYVVIRRARRGILLTDENLPLSLEDEAALFGRADGGFTGVEQRWLETVDEDVREGYVRAREYQQHNPPDSLPNEITLSQLLSIQEKGVSAWAFEPDYERNAGVIVESRTEVTFLGDGYGMSQREGGACCVQANLPVPRINEVYYFEVKLYDVPSEGEPIDISIGLATRPYPATRHVGYSRYSVGYMSDGMLHYSYPFTGRSYGPELRQGDVLGVGYKPRTGTVFFTRNGKRLRDAFTHFHQHVLFPTIAAGGPCSLHVNLGQMGFVFIEANVKKWGYAPMVGTLAPPPAYGKEEGSILLQASTSTPGADSSDNGVESGRRRAAVAPSPLRLSTGVTEAQSSPATIVPTIMSPSPTTPLEINATPRRTSDSHTIMTNPPTPGLLDISLRSLNGFPLQGAPSDSDADSSDEDFSEETIRASQPSSSSLPPYNPIDPGRYAPGVAEALLEDALGTSNYNAALRNATRGPTTESGSNRTVLSEFMNFISAQPPTSRH